MMFLNNTHITPEAIRAYHLALRNSTPNHVVIDGLFNPVMLDAVVQTLHQPRYWQTQRHTYSRLYVDHTEWRMTEADGRFVQRDIWKGTADNDGDAAAREFIGFLRSDEFMAVLSRIFRVGITDRNVADPAVNTNYFRLGASDFVQQHADDSPGREVCMLLYLNKGWDSSAGGELEFLGEDGNAVRIVPLYNRCVLFDPSSAGAEHRVRRVTADQAVFRYNVTSWYWRE